MNCVYICRPNSDLPERKAGETWEPGDKAAVFGYRGAWDREVRLHCQSSTDCRATLNAVWRRTGFLSLNI